MQNAPRRAMLDRIEATEDWLKDHPDDTNVRNGYLGLLSKQPVSQERLRRALNDAESWLDDHPKDTYTRQRYQSLRKRTAINAPQREVHLHIRLIRACQ